MTKCRNCGKTVRCFNSDGGLIPICKKCLAILKKENQLVDIHDNMFTKSHWFWPIKFLGKPILLVDFDHTITSQCLACGDKDYDLFKCEPQPEAKKILDDLHNRYTIIIFTGRVSGAKQIIEYLKLYKIPFDVVQLNKPQACFIIDDRAIHHVSWLKTSQEIKRRGG